MQKMFRIFQSKMVSIKADSHNKCCLFQIFIFSAQLLNYVTSDFCSTCNCCFPNKLQAENSLKSPHHNGADLILNNNILVQNDDALFPPNPKPLVAEQTPKFYKISTSNNQEGLLEKIPFTILQEARPSNVASQAILFPVPVAALIVQPLANNPKCDCPTDSSFITSTSSSMKMPNEMCSNCEQKKNDSYKCDSKCEKSNGEESEADGHIEVEDEKTADEGDGKTDGDCSHEAGTDEINCHGEHEESKEHADAVGSEGTKEMCHDCEKTREKSAYKYSTNGAEEITESTTFSEHQNQYSHQEQKIPIEVFKKFVAKSTGFEVQTKPIPDPDSERTVQSKDKMRHEDSFENLKERLKEISNKMDLLKNLSMEMKGYPRQFPMARFFNNERMVGNSEKAALQARIFGGNQYQPAAEHSPQIKSINQQQKWNHFTQNQLQQFEPTTPPIMITNQRTILGVTSDIDKSLVQMTSTTSTTINHQQFLLNAIEEFLRESQKIRDKQVPITNDFAKNNTMHQQISKTTTTTKSAAALQTPSITLGIQMENTSPISSLIVTNQTYEGVTPILNSSSFDAFTSNITNSIIATTTSPISNSTINNTDNIQIIMTTENPIIAKMNSFNEIESTLLIKTNDSKNLGEIINAENLQPTPEPFNPQKWFYSTTNIPIDGKIANFQEQTSQMKGTHKYVLTKSIEIETTQVTETIANSTAIATNEQTIQQPIMADQPPFGDYEQQESAEKHEETESYESTIPLEGNMTVRSAPIKKQPTNAHSRLINLITSIKTQSDEIGFFEKNGDKQEHPKFLSTRHIKEDEKEELEGNSANIESYHYYILMLCLIIFIYFP